MVFCQDIKEAVQKRPSAAFPSSFVVATYYKYDSLLRISGALHLDIFEQPLVAIFLCLFKGLLERAHLFRRFGIFLMHVHIVLSILPVREPVLVSVGRA